MSIPLPRPPKHPLTARPPKYKLNKEEKKVVEQVTPKAPRTEHLTNKPFDGLSGLIQTSEENPKEKN